MMLWMAPPRARECNGNAPERIVFAWPAGAPPTSIAGCAASVINAARSPECRTAPANAEAVSKRSLKGSALYNHCPVSGPALLDDHHIVSTTVMVARAVAMASTVAPAVVISAIVPNDCPVTYRRPLTDVHRQLRQLDSLLCRAAFHRIARRSEADTGERR